MIQRCIDENRRIQASLRPPTIDILGILATSEWFLREYRESYPDIGIKVQIDIREDEIPVSLKIVIFRILQEALHNIAKHSGASQVQISLRKVDGNVELEIQDNGRGFDMTEAASRECQGLGLASMKDRSRLSGGSCVVETAVGSGTVVRASWPLQEPVEG
jgi:signal transduction histidine kinase